MTRHPIAQSAGCLAVSQYQRCWVRNALTSTGSFRNEAGSFTHRPRRTHLMSLGLFSASVFFTLGIVDRGLLDGDTREQLCRRMYAQQKFIGPGCPHQCPEKQLVFASRHRDRRYHRPRNLGKGCRFLPFLAERRLTCQAGRGESMETALDATASSRR